MQGERADHCLEFHAPSPQLRHVSSSKDDNGWKEKEETIYIKRS